MSEETTQVDEATAAAAGTEMTPETEDVLEALRDVVDPELGVNVVDLGLVYGVTLGGDGVATIDMTLTSAACSPRSTWSSKLSHSADQIVAGLSGNLRPARVKGTAWTKVSFPGYLCGW